MVKIQPVTLNVCCGISKGLGYLWGDSLVKLKDYHLLLLEALQGIHVQLDAQAGLVGDDDLAINDL